MARHTSVGWISLAAGTTSYLLALYNYVVGVGAVDILIVTCLILAVAALITGLFARFGKEKDNLGIPGILSIIVVPLMLVAGL